MRSLCGVVIKTAQSWDDLIARQNFAKVRIQLRQHGEAFHQEWHGAARMREDELDVFAPRRRAAEQNAGDRACGVSCKLDG